MFATPYELGPKPWEPVPSVEEQERDLVEEFEPLRGTRTLVELSEESLFEHDRFLKIRRVGEEIRKFLDRTTIHMGRVFGSITRFIRYFTRRFPFRTTD